MTSTYDSRGRRVGATIVEIAPNFVTQINDNSLQLGYGTKKSVKKPQLGHTKKVGLEQPIRWFREVEKNGDDIQPGTEIKLDQVFSLGDAVRVTGTSKGKGFQGGVRRWGFHGGPKTHGQSDKWRSPGSIGAGTTPGRIIKGLKMAGRMGNAKVTIKGLSILRVDSLEKKIVVSGPVPGPRNNKLQIRIYEN